MYNSGNSSKNVTGASVVDGTLENADYADNGLSGDKIDGGIISNFQSTGIDDRLPTGKVLTLSDTGADVTGSVTCDGFTSTGIDDNATSTAITIDASENVAMAGNVNIADNKLLYMGTGNDSFAYHSGTDFNLKNGTGEFKIRNEGVAQLTSFYNRNSGSLDKKTMDVGGTTPTVILYYNGIASCSARAGGIAFGTDTAAANTLDDYEEGTWTPVVTPNSGTITTISTLWGRYTKIGDTVTVSLRVNIGDFGTASGGMNVGGLPFAVASETAASGHNASTGAYVGGAFVLSTQFATYVTWANHNFLFSATYRV